MHPLSGRYVLGDVVGERGWFVEYAAEDSLLRVPRTVRVLRPKLADRVAAYQRLRRGVSQVESLRHPGLGRVLDMGQDGETFFVVTETYAVDSLWERLRQVGSLSTADAVELAIGVLDALMVLHARGVVHGDITPMSVALNEAGCPVVRDVGFASALGVCQEGGSAGRSLDAFAFAFVSPEQRSGYLEPGPAADVYGVATTLFALLTGATPTDLFMVPEGGARWELVDEPLRAPLLRATRYEEGERYANAGAFAVALREAAEVLASPSRTEPVEEPLVEDPARDLVAWYRASLGAQHRRLGELLGEHQRGDLGGVPGLRALAHRLVGSGSTFGFPSITEAARSVLDAAQTDFEVEVGVLLQRMRSVAMGGADDARVVAVITHTPAAKERCLVAIERCGHHVVEGEARAAAGAPDVGAVPELYVLEVTAGGLDRIGELGDVAGRPKVPVLAIGASPDLESAALAHGARRFFSSPIDPVELAEGVEAELRRGADQERLDAATGLPDPLSFVLAVRRVKRSGQGGIVGLIGLSSLRPIALGTAHWDVSMRDVAERLREVLPEGAVLGRWGRSALGVLVPERSGWPFALDWAGALARATRPGLPLLVVARAGLVELPFDAAGRCMIEAAEQLKRAMEGPAGSVLVRAGARARMKSVLVVDDDVCIGRMVGELLRSEGVLVRHLGSGEDCLSVARELEPTLIVLDIELPGDDGYVALGALQGDRDLRHIPVIVLSARAEEQDRALGLEMGAMDYVTKPFEPNALRERLKHYLRR